MATRLEGIKCSAEPLSITLHPNRNILVAGLVNGKVEIHDYSSNKDNSDITKSSGDRDDIEDDTDDNASVRSSVSNRSNSSSCSSPSETTKTPSQTLQTIFPLHKKSCRSLTYNTSGTTLYTAGSDSSLCAIDTETNKLLYNVKETHPGSINRMTYIPPSSFSDENSSSISQELLATGDDNGVIRIWDAKTSGMLCHWDNHEDFISGFAVKDYNLLSSSADGSISIYDLRKLSKENKALIKQSDYQQDELLCISIIKNGKKVVCGTADGSLLTFSWNYWTDPDDKYGGHPASVDSIVKINDEDTLITGSSDGLCRLVQIHPNMLLGVIANHYDGFPVEGMCLAGDYGVLATFSHDDCVRLWDTSIMLDGDDDIEEEDDVPEKKSLVKVKRSSDDEWDDDDSDSDDSDSDGDTNVPKKQRTIKNDNEMFFADL